MNAPTTPTSAMQKASFYDSIVEKIRDGLDEGVAVSEAVEEVAQRTVNSGGTHGRRSSSFTDRPPSLALGRKLSFAAGVPSSAPRPSAEPTEPVVAQPDTTPQPPSTPAQPSRLKGFFESIIKPSIQKGAEQAKVQKPLRPSSTTKTRAERKSVLIKDPGGSGDEESDEGDEDEEESGVSMTQLRMLHRKLMMVVDTYDRVTRERNEGTLGGVYI